MDYLYQIDADNLTPKQVAGMFARQHFDQPRKVDSVTVDGDSTLFTLADGRRVYRIDYHPALRSIRPAVYRVTVDK